MARKKAQVYDRASSPPPAGSIAASSDSSCPMACRRPGTATGSSCSRGGGGLRAPGADHREAKVDDPHHDLHPRPGGRRRGARGAAGRRAAEGVAVRLLLDDVGSWRVGRRFLAPLLKAGARVAYFMPVLHVPFRGRANLRNHRKIVVVDGRIALTGGMNLAWPYMGPMPDPDFWRDLSAVVEGPAVPTWSRSSSPTGRSPPARISRQPGREPGTRPREATSGTGRRSGAKGPGTASSKWSPAGPTCPTIRSTRPSSR